MTEQTPRRTTQAERDRAMAVNSVDDSTRVHGDQDETGLVMTGTGELRHLDETGQLVDPDADDTWDQTGGA